MDVLWLILAGAALALVAPWVHKRSAAAARWLLPLGPLAATVYLARLVPEIAAGGELLSSRPWAAQVGLTLSWRIDGLSLLMMLLVTGMGALVLVHAGSYLAGHRHLGRLYALVLLFMVSMLGLLSSDDLLLLFIFWELTSITSYFLIGFHHERPEARAAALQALLVTGGGGLALLAAAVLLTAVAGTGRVSELAAAAGALHAHGLYAAIVVLVLLAAGSKSAQFPLHFWLPGAMTAPSPISAYLHAATMVKAGVYLLARLSPALGGTSLWHDSLWVMGGVTMLVAASRAMLERHAKRVLAYSTVGALGVLVLLIGVGSRQAIEAAVVFLTAHALYKGALFLLAGAVEHATHETELSRLRALGTAMPRTAVASGLAALSMAGVPPLYGYIAKDLVYAAALDGSVRALALLAALVVGSAFFVAIAIDVGVRPFLGRDATATARVHEPSWSLWAPALVLALLGVLLGPWPTPMAGLQGAAANAVLGQRAELQLTLWHGFGLPLALSAATFALGFGLYFSRARIRKWAEWFSPLGRFAPGAVYQGSLRALLGLAGAQTRLLQNGRLRVYLLVTFLTTIGLTAAALLGGGALPTLAGAGEGRGHELATAAVVLATAVAASRSSSRFAAILSMGAVGFGVSLLFLMLGAPDVGITQLVVETLTVIFLVLAFFHLPKFAVLSSGATRVRDMLVSLAFGAVMTLLVLAVAGAPAPDKVSGFFGRASLLQAHGRNVVNVILTDFRALDTLGEIAVLAVAAFGVVALLGRTRVRAGGPWAR